MFEENETTRTNGGAGAPYGSRTPEPGAAPYGGPQGASGPGNPPYGSPYGTQVREKRDGQAYGIASLVLGFLALLLFCACINVPLAILSLFFGMVQIIGYKDKLLAGFGIALSAASLILMIVAIMVFTGVSVNITGFGNGAGSYEEYLEQYFNNLEELEDGSF